MVEACYVNFSGTWRYVGYLGNVARSICGAGDEVVDSRVGQVLQGSEMLLWTDVNNRACSWC